MQQVFRKLCLGLLFFCTLSLTVAVAQQRISAQNYIEQNKSLAQQLMEETGVPASVILAVAIHESAYGNSRIARHLNNHFGIKGKNQSKTIRSAYKGYDTPLDSYRDFVGLLKRRKATQPLFEQHSSTDYQAWLLGIARSGYSVSSDWRSKVLRVISRYNLSDYDK